MGAAACRCTSCSRSRRLHRPARRKRGRHLWSRKGLSAAPAGEEKADHTAGWITDLLELQCVSESLFDSFDEAYPILAEAFSSAAEPATHEYSEEEIGTLQGEYAKELNAALASEQTRVKPKEIELSDDTTEAYIQHRMNLPKRLAEEPNEERRIDPQQRRNTIRRIRKPRRGKNNPVAGISASSPAPIKQGLRRCIRGLLPQISEGRGTPLSRRTATN